MNSRCMQVKWMYISNNILLIVYRSNIRKVMWVVHDLMFKMSYIEILRFWKIIVHIQSIHDLPKICIPP